MCDPITATIAVAGTLVSAGASVYAGNVQAKSAMQTAQLQAMGMEQEAAFKRRAADAEAAAGQFGARRQQENASRVIANQRNALASSGVLIDEGTPVDLLIDSELESSMDQAATEWSAGEKSRNMREQAKISETNAAFTRIGGKMQADAARTGGYISAVSTIAGSATKFAGMPGGTSFGKSLFGM